MKKELFYATNNPGKVIEVLKFLSNSGITVLTPKDLKIKLDVPEIGSSLEKRIFESKSLPGIHVRRWKDGQTKMTDEEIIDYCLSRMKNVPITKRGAQFRTVLVLGIPGGGIEVYSGTLKGVILEKAASLRVEGFPFESLFYVSEWNKLLGETHHMSMEEKRGRLNHRERALEKVIPRIQELIT
ncbi:hypothetical protein COT44_01040 [Candidatus Shapirobacteria bacterium CG08_land_8_20_14_0_20_39_18]|uniref:Non-canonical purine NTP pyrophosphatase n=1 Tax=Candidatus Shapirobacteria bacterium CG08_land_8_20_14_0_20_39_18 TaxID=1974883 RepID=A0A2M6XDU4_9BACT|nr:MAG: hypothetical protein COT44_01040 [Candidatus Shapirobacteria bacterium CG08_land_8_20_14_0_20_39_18]PJE68636.1 MAG: hypothetical protein COU94_01115 [Candidatus Shapirobacteria bacterium CG10_big_fil_rev_8_21_14_0_10_38_8]